jgi:hypothetical protein
MMNKSFSSAKEPIVAISSRVSTTPVGLPGLVSSSAFVRGVTRRSSASRSA